MAGTPMTVLGSTAPACTLLFCHAAGFGKSVFAPHMTRLVNHRQGGHVSENIVTNVPNHHQEEVNQHATVARPDHDARGRFRAVAIDLCGHGQNQARAAEHMRLHGETPMDWHSMTQVDVDAAVNNIISTSSPADTSARQPIVGVGHSMGGTSLLLRQARFPGTFSALVLAEPVLFLPSLIGHLVRKSKFNPLYKGAMRRRDHFRSLEDARAHFLKTPFSKFHPECLEAYLQGCLESDPVAEGLRLCCRPQFEAQIYRSAPAGLDLLKQIDDVPIRILVGSKSPKNSTLHLSHKLYRKMAALLPNATFEIVDGGGHLWPLEQPEALVRAIHETANQVLPP